MKIDYMKINRRRLNLELARKQWDKRTLAIKAGVSYEQVRRVTAQNSEGAAPKMIGKLAAALGVDVLDIIEEE